jgi:hypothetical protein
MVGRPGPAQFSVRLQTQTTCPVWCPFTDPTGQMPRGAFDYMVQCPSCHATDSNPVGPGTKTYLKAGPECGDSASFVSH